MSSISDALKRAQEERERARGDTPTHSESPPNNPGDASLASVVLRKSSLHPPLTPPPSSIPPPTAAPPRPPTVRTQIAETIVEDYTSKRNLALPESMVVYHDRSGPIAAQYRKIRDNLMTENAKRDHQILVITSAVPREGKTVTLLNLGLSLVEIRTNRVLLVDACLHSRSKNRPTSLTQIMKLIPDPGLHTLLQSPEPDLAPLLKPTPWPNLFILPAGQLTTPTAAAQLLKSPALPALLRQAKATFDWILIDAPASFTYPDASLIATTADSLLLALALHQTPAEKIAQTTRRLKSLNLPLKACIATKTT